MRNFGTTITETINAFSNSSQKKDLNWNASVSGKTPVKDDKSKALGRIIVTILLIIVAIYLLKNDTKSQLGASIISAIIGYWLK
jgi:hypothetical protein